MKNLMYSEFSDEQLIGRFLKGDNHSVGILYGRYYPKVYAKCYSFSRNGDDAFDMAQEVLLKTICNIESFEETRNSQPGCIPLQIIIASLSPAGKAGDIRRI